MRLTTRRPAALVAVAGLAFAAAGLTTQPANAGPGESTLVSLTNNARASNGLAPYAVAGDLSSIARDHAARMAASHAIYHNPSLTSAVCCWSEVGENVGVGPSVSAVHDAFMSSSMHRSNILSRSYTQVGIGTAVGSDGRVYVDEVFRLPTGAPAPAPAPVKPRQTPSPAPAHQAPARATRSEQRAPLVVHVPSARELLARRLVTLTRWSGLRTHDPVQRTLAWASVMRRLQG